MKHKHAEYIYAWADGKTIEAKSEAGNWQEVCGTPRWDANEYRIKPEPVVLYVNEYEKINEKTTHYGDRHYPTETEARQVGPLSTLYIRTIKLQEVADNE